MSEAAIKSLTDWPSKIVLPKGDHLQEVVGAARDLAAASGLDRRRNALRVLTDWRLAQIVTAGPAGEADYTDERYWVQFMAISESDPTDTLQVELDSSESISIITATNLNEWQQSTHFMSQGDLVWVRGKLDIGQPQQTHWAFDTQPRRPIFVHLSVASGSNGSSTTAATYTYDLLNPDSGLPIPGATGLAPAGQREQGLLLGAAGIGLARLSPSNTWTIIWCDERAAITPNCPG